MQAVCEEHVGGGSFVGSGDDSQGPLLPISVGIEVNFGFMKKLIPRFSALPIRKSLTLTTTADFQLVGMVKVRRYLTISCIIYVCVLDTTCIWAEVLVFVDGKIILMVNVTF